MPPSPLRPPSVSTALPADRGLRSLPSWCAAHGVQRGRLPQHPTALPARCPSAGLAVNPWSSTAGVQMRDVIGYCAIPQRATASTVTSTRQPLGADVDQGWSGGREPARLEGRCALRPAPSENRSHGGGRSARGCRRSATAVRFRYVFRSWARDGSRRSRRSAGAGRAWRVGRARRTRWPLPAVR